MPNPNDPLAQRAQECAEKVVDHIVNLSDDAAAITALTPFILDALRDAVEPKDALIFGLQKSLATSHTVASRLFIRLGKVRTALAAAEKGRGTFKKQREDAWLICLARAEDINTLRAQLAAAQRERDDVLEAAAKRVELRTGLRLDALPHVEAMSLEDQKRYWLDWAAHMIRALKSKVAPEGTIVRPEPWQEEAAAIAQDRCGGDPAPPPAKLTDSEFHEPRSAPSCPECNVDAGHRAGADAEREATVKFLKVLSDNCGCCDGPNPCANCERIEEYIAARAETTEARDE